MLGVDPHLIVANDKVALLRESRAKAQQAQAAAQAMQQGAAVQQQMANTPTSPDNKTALTDVMNMFSGYGSPSAVEV
jgi:hypothetical protein